MTTGFNSIYIVMTIMNIFSLLQFIHGNYQQNKKINEINDMVS